MKVRYIYSACVIIETEEITICYDPWFSPGAYDGSWYQYPPLKENPLDIIGANVDVIYISHIHPDHYDPKFIKKYLSRYPETKIAISKNRSFLYKKMQIDGLQPVEISHDQVGKTNLYIFPNNAYEFDNIDTALVVTREKLSVANLNDNPFDRKQIDEILSACPTGRPTLAMLPYSGAGPYPQTYEFNSVQELEVAAEVKKEQFLNLYSSYIKALKPVRALPFAGKYFLGGPLSRLNKYRGTADQTDVLSKYPEISVVLADGGQAFIDLKTLEVSEVRSQPYDRSHIEKYLALLPFEGYDYEKEIVPIEGHSLPIFPLVKSAYSNAIEKTHVQEPYYFCIKPNKWKKYIVINCFSKEEVVLADNVDTLCPRSEIFIDERYLFGLLVRFYHWNNAAIGSHYRVKRVPDIYKIEVFAFLNRFHV